MSTGFGHLPYVVCSAFFGLITGWFIIPVVRHFLSVSRLLTVTIVACSGLAFGGVFWWISHAFGLPSNSPLGAVAWWARAVAYLGFAAVGIALTVIDIGRHRLPNAITIPAFFIIALLLTGASVLGETEPHWERLVGVLGGAAILCVFYLVLALIAPNSMGSGDVKLAPLIGAALGYLGWGALIVGALSAFVLGALWSLALIVFGRGNRATKIPFGPFMIVGAWVGILFGEMVSLAHIL